MAENCEALNLIAGRWTPSKTTREVSDKYSGEPRTVLHTASASQVYEAVTAGIRAVEAAHRSNRWTAFDRYQALSKAATGVQAASESLVDTVMQDTGFVRADAVNEVARTVQTLQLSAEAARQVGTGELIPLDGAPGGAGRLGFTMRFPVGVVAAITPFNSPLNTVAHKIGPALAAGNAVVLKPANSTPLSANALARLLLDAGVPEGLLSVVHGDGPIVGQALLADERVGFYTLTGSTAVGQAVARAAGLRRSQLELGSIASTIVCSDADVSSAIAKIVPAAMRKAGQVCTSVQRLYVESDIVKDLSDALVDAVSDIVFGDPSTAETGVGPLISSADAERIDGWIAAAQSGGAKVLQGGTRNRSVIAPTVLADVKQDMDVLRREIFGPVVCLLPFDDLPEAVARANDTPYGLAAGIFTRDLDRAFWAARNLRFGGVHINQTSSSRLDLMPFGGVKASGYGHEGPVYAAREMTEERFVTITTREL